MLGRNYCLFCLVVLMALLTGCAGNSVKPAAIVVVPPELQTFPRDVNITNTRENIQLQLDLAQRNLYQTRDGHTRLLSSHACEIDLVAHRGYINYPENSISGVTAAFAAGFPKVEVDIMRLRDGTWVLHHDAVTGRATGFLNGDSLTVSAMNAASFSRLRLRDPKTLQLTSELAPTLPALLNSLSQVMGANQRLQIEFKSTASAHELMLIDRLLTKTLSQRYEYVAQDIALLTQLRQLNPWVYLGILEVPASSSMRELARQKAALQDTKPTRVSRWAEQKSQDAYRKRRTNWLTPANMTILRQRLGDNVGIHLDHAALIQQQAAVARAKKLNIPIYTYTVTSHAQHMSALGQLKNKKVMPFGAIIDDTPLNVCSAFFNVISPAIAGSPPDAFILRLPSNADFSVLNEQKSLMAMGQYRKNTGEIVQVTSIAPRTAPIPLLLKANFHAVKDELLDLRGEGALRLHLHNKSAKDKKGP